MLARWSFSDVCRSRLPRGHSRNYSSVWRALPTNLEMSSAWNDENIRPVGSDRNDENIRRVGSRDIETCAHSKRAPLMSGFWTPAGDYLCGRE